MIEIQKLSAGYAGKAVLRQISLTIPKGKVTVLLGPNGCGKSTLLKTLCGILPVSKGVVLLDGENLLEIPHRKRAWKVAYLAQSRRIPDITVRRMVLHGRFPYLSYPRRYRAEDYAAAEGAMAQMGLSGLADVPLQNLSGGQRQKAYIAMALAQDTQVVLLDEPTTYLDVRHQMQMMAEARALSGRGKTVMMVLHDLPHALQTADQIVLMENGRIVAQAPPEEMFASAQLERVFGVRIGRISSENGWCYYYKGGVE